MRGGTAEHARRFGRGKGAMHEAPETRRTLTWRAAKWLVAVERAKLIVFSLLG